MAADRAGQSEAHGRQPIGHEARVGLVGGVEPGHPHLHGTGIGEDDVSTVKGGAGCGDDPLRLEGEAVIDRAPGEVVGQQAPDLLATRAQLETAAGGSGQGFEGPADIRLDPHLDVIVRVDLGREPAQVEDALVPAGVDPLWIEFLELIAHADDHIGLVETEVHMVVAHEAHRAESIRVVVGKDPLSMEGGRNGKSQHLGEADQGSCRAAPRRTVAGEHDRSAGPIEHGGHARDLRGRRLVRAWDIHGEGCCVVPHDQSFDVFGDCEKDRSGAFGLRQLERLAHHLGDCTLGEDHVGPLGDRGEHRHQVDALMGFLVDAAQSDLRGDGHEGSAVAVGIGRPEEEVYRSRTEGG